MRSRTSHGRRGSASSIRWPWPGGAARRPSAGCRRARARGSPGPGGADGIAIAPRRFGSASGLLLLAIDQDAVSGRVLAIDRKGGVRAVATGLGNGLNPILQ